MKTNYLKLVTDIFREKREAAINNAEEKKQELYEKIDTLRSLDAELAKTGTKILSAAMAGGDVSKNIEEIKKENEKLTEQRKALLIANGYPSDYTDVHYECAKCSDSGYLGIRMCDCFTKELAFRRLVNSDFGHLANTQSFESFSFKYYQGASLTAAQKNYKLLREFAENSNFNKGENFLLLGDTGLGKTHLSTAVGITAIKRGYNVIYCSVQSMLDDFEGYRFRNDYEIDINGYYDCNLLIIDDLGVEMANSFTVSCLYEILNKRMIKQKSTMISTNLTQNELRGKYADRITSRLFGEFFPLLFTGTDIRRQKLQ